jgi:hypothetical protein
LSKKFRNRLRNSKKTPKLANQNTITMLFLYLSQTHYYHFMFNFILCAVAITCVKTIARRSVKLA